MRAKRILTAMLAALAAAAPAGAAEADPAKVELLRSAVSEVRAQAEGLTDRLAGPTIEFLRGAGPVLDEQGIKNPEHREAFLAVTAATMTVAALSAFDASAAQLGAGAPEAFRMPLTRLLAAERGRLEDFLGEAPLTVLAVVRVSSPSTPAAEIISLVEEAAAAGDFAGRLRRAAPRGDAAIRRLVMRTVARPASALAGPMAVRADDFTAALARILKEQGVTDVDQRRLLLSARRQEVTGPMLAEYDRFAASTKEAFAGAGALIDTAAVDALALERGRLVERLESDIIEKGEDAPR